MKIFFLKMFELTLYPLIIYYTSINISICPDYLKVALISHKLWHVRYWIHCMTFTVIWIFCQRCTGLHKVFLRVSFTRLQNKNNKSTSAILFFYNITVVHAWEDDFLKANICNVWIKGITSLYKLDLNRLIGKRFLHS